MPTSFTSDPRLTVGVVAGHWPGWAIPFSHSKFILQWIVTCEKGLLSGIRRCFPTAIIWLNTEFESNKAVPVDIIAFNGPLTRLIDPPSFGTLLLFDWNVRCKGAWKDWTSKVYKFSHSKAGGVSDHTGIVKVCCHCSSSDFDLSSAEIDTFPAASLGSILNHTEKGEELVTAPRLARLSFPSVTNVTHKSYHPDGLFPVNTVSPNFLVPCVFVPSRWVKRTLTRKESLAVLDIPASMISILSPREQSLILDNSGMPIKSLVAIMSTIFIKGCVSIIGGGGNVDKREEKEGTLGKESKGSKVESAAQAGEEERKERSESELAPSPCSATETGNNIPGAWEANTKHNRDEKAAKNDDAGIPIHFWNDSLAEKLHLKALSAEQQKAMDTLRTFFVRAVWVRNVTRCFCRYIRCKPCHLARLEGMFDFKNKQLVFNCARCKKGAVNTSKVGFVELQGNSYRWKKGGRLGYRRWFKVVRKEGNAIEAEEIRLDIEVGVDCIRRSIACTPWNWKAGSRLFFWRWGEFRNVARDGARTFIKSELPQYSKRQKAPKKAKILKLVQDKLMDVREKGYIAKGEVISVTSLFDVPKGDNDIRLVYDATKSGLNEACWAPWFSLQTCESHLRSVDPGTYMGDADLGEMFLNFPLDKHIRKYAGVDLTEIFPGEGESEEEFWERWERMLMGFRPSPYCTTREMRRIDNFLRGSRFNPQNIFRWKSVVLNLPGMTDYTSTKPRVYRIRDDDVMAADLFSYIDDLRNTAPTGSECWDGLHQVCCRLTWLGLQDAPRKRNGPTRTPRAWAGSIIHTDNALVSVLVSEEKWDKTKTWIAWVLKHVMDKKGLNYKDLLSCRGFLIYVSRTYTPFKPYLRGLHKTIDSWRPFRDKDGWKLMESVIAAKVLEDDYVKLDQAGPSSKFIQPLPRLERDFQILADLTSPEAPPKVTRRRTKMALASYGFGDASGTGFGHSIQVGDHIYSEFGEWSAEVEDKHSNYKELRNLVNAVKKAYHKGLLKDCELFLFTDNFVAECGYYNGGSNRNKELDDLVHELWRLQMGGDFTLNVYHVAGTRMIECGIDGLSRGDKTEGIARGISVFKFIPIHLSPIDRSPGVLGWIRSWWDESLGNLHLMEPEDWFTKSMELGNFIWNVAPGAGEAAVEQLCSHTQGRPESQHIFIIPRLCTCHFRKQLLKSCDVVLTIQPKFSFWDTNMHEPLLVGFYLPLLPPDYRYRPWRLKHTKFVAEFRLEVHRMQVASGKMDWDILRKFLLRARSIPSLPDGMARKLLQT